MSTSKPDLGDFIRKRREELGLTQRDVALHVGFKSLAHLSDIEGGNRKPGEEHMRKFAEVLQVEVKDLEEHDARIPVRETKELLEDRPEMVAAFRRVISSARTMSPDDLIRLVESGLPDPPQEKEAVE